VKYMKIGKKKTKPQVNPTLAGVAVAGAVVGAGVVAATTALKDKKNQKKMKTALKTVSKRAKGYLDEAQSRLPKDKGAQVEKIEKKLKASAPGKKVTKKSRQ